MDPDHAWNPDNLWILDNLVNQRPPSSTRDALIGLSHMLAMPQGFTLSVAGTVAIMIGHRGFPGPLAVWLFVVGAAGAFSAIAVVVGAHLEPSNNPVTVVGLALLNVTPVVIVPLACLIAWWIPGDAAAFAVAGAATSGLYVVMEAEVLTVLHRREPTFTPAADPPDPRPSE